MTGVPVPAADGATVTVGDTTPPAPTTFQVSPGELWCVMAWQSDGLVALVAGVAVVNAVPSAPGAAALAVRLAACRVWAGPRRTGRAHRGLLRRFGRA